MSQKDVGKNSPKPIKGIVEGLLEGWRGEKAFQADLVSKAWNKVIGRKAAKHTKTYSLKTGRLIVEVDGSGWIYQLTLKKQDILKKLNKYLKDIKIDEIRFRIGNFK